jgi:Telomeric repeat-binding factor 2.
MRMQFKSITAIVVLLLVVASLLVAGCTTTRNEQTVSANSTANQASNQNSPQLTVTATSLGSSSTLSSSYGTPTAAATNNKFVTYAMYFQNLNKKDLNMGNPTEIKLRDTSGNIYSYDSFTYSLQQQVNGVTLKGLSYESNTQPGDKYSGLIAFQIPTSATPKSLTYDDYTNKITVNL